MNLKNLCKITDNEEPVGTNAAKEALTPDELEALAGLTPFRKFLYLSDNNLEPLFDLADELLFDSWGEKVMAVLPDGTLVFITAWRDPYGEQLSYLSGGKGEYHELYDFSFEEDMSDESEDDEIGEDGSYNDKDEDGNTLDQVKERERKPFMVLKDYPQKDGIKNLKEELEMYL